MNYRLFFLNIPHFPDQEMLVLYKQQNSENAEVGNQMQKCYNETFSYSNSFVNKLLG